MLRLFRCSCACYEKQRNFQLGHISTFRYDVLKSRGLEKPTGLPLYTYRITAAEFESLECGLCEYLVHQQSFERLGEIARNRSWFPSLFVLYASEWWRREYDGSGWAWDPILERLRVNAHGWNPSQRSACVEQGLKDWKISISQFRGFRFLGSVALQGGLPMKLLAAAQGRLGSLLSRVLRDAASSSARENEVEDWIQVQVTSLPEIYQRSEIVRLLTDTVMTVLDLKHRTSLSSDSDPILKLDTEDPCWRDAFPLPIEDSQARQLLEQLVKDVAAVRLHRSPSFAIIDRELEFDGDGWKLQSTLKISDYVESQLLKKTFGLAQDALLPRSVAIQVEQGKISSEMSATRLAGRDLFRISRRPPISTGDDAAAEHWLILVLPDGTRRRILAKKGETLSNDLPWVFENMEGAKPVLVRQGSAAVSNETGIVCIPYSWRAESNGGSEIHACGSLIDFGRQVYKFRGTVTIEDSSGGVFRCRSCQADGAKYLGWVGTRSTEIQWLSPKEAFRGLPRLCYLSESDDPSPIPGQIEWKLNGQRVLNFAESLGPVEAKWVRHGEIEWRSRVVLLGKGRHISVNPGSTPTSGTIQFPDWRLARVFSDTESIRVEASVDGDTLSANVDYAGPGSPPEYFDLCAYWRGNPQMGRIQLPFPAFGAHCFDPRGSRLVDGQTLSSDSLFGYRLIAFVKRTDPTRLRFTLCTNGHESDVTTINLVPPEEGRRIEVRLVDHLARINRMLANAGELDAYVRVDLQVGATPSVSLKIARYSCSLGRDQSADLVFVEMGANSLTPDSLASAVLEAVRLDDPGEEPHRLSPVESHGLTVGWKFPMNQLEAAPWLIIPGPQSGVRFRPLLWTIHDHRDDVYSDSALKRALNSTDPHDRSERLADSIWDLSTNFEANDWRIVETTASQFCHLPLCAFDLWREFSRSKWGMAAIALRSHRFPSGFLERFCSEMPSVWEGVPLRIWVEVMRTFDVFEQGLSIGKLCIQSKIEEIGSILPSLRVLLEVGATIATRKTTKDVEAVLQCRIDLSKRLFEGVDSPHQALLRDGADLEWPTDLEPVIQLARQGRLARFLRVPEVPFHRDSVVNLPILLGAIAATGIDVGFDIERHSRAIRHYQDFCPDWFTNAFDLTVARCIAERAIQELEELFGAEALL